MTVSFGPLVLSRHTPRIVAAVGYNDCQALSLEAPKAGADIVELRLDQFPNLETPAGRKAALETAKEIKSACAAPLLATIRRKEEGGGFPADETTRIAMYRDVMPLADAVDVELQADDARNAVIEAGKRQGIPVILSYHDFKGCPDDAMLDRLVADGFRHGAAVVKIAVTPRRQSDVVRLLAFTECNADLPIAIIAMGEMGRVSRLLFPAFGSRLTYGCIGEEKLAPGQLHVKDVRAVLNMMMS